MKYTEFEHQKPNGEWVDCFDQTGKCNYTQRKKVKQSKNSKMLKPVETIKKNVYIDADRKLTEDEIYSYADSDDYRVRVDLANNKSVPFKIGDENNLLKYIVDKETDERAIEEFKNSDNEYVRAYLYSRDDLFVGRDINELIKSDDNAVLLGLALNKNTQLTNLRKLLRHSNDNVGIALAGNLNLSEKFKDEFIDYNIKKSTKTSKTKNTYIENRHGNLALIYFVNFNDATDKQKEKIYYTIKDSYEYENLNKKHKEPLREAKEAYELKEAEKLKALTAEYRNDVTNPYKYLDFEKMDNYYGSDNPEELIEHIRVSSLNNSNTGVDKIAVNELKTFILDLDSSNKDSLNIIYNTISSKASISFRDSNNNYKKYMIEDLINSFNKSGIANDEYFKNSFFKNYKEESY